MVVVGPLHHQHNGRHFNTWASPCSMLRGCRTSCKILLHRLHCIAAYYAVEEEMLSDVVRLLVDECVVIGVARGRAEFGPRALGNRSLLAVPMSEKCRDKTQANPKDVMNDIKVRQWWQPVCTFTVFIFLVCSSCPCTISDSCTSLQRSDEWQYCLGRFLGRCRFEYIPRLSSFVACQNSTLEKAIRWGKSPRLVDTLPSS